MELNLDGIALKTAPKLYGNTTRTQKKTKCCKSFLSNFFSIFRAVKYYRYNPIETLIYVVATSSFPCVRAFFKSPVINTFACDFDELKTTESL